ncbi:MAG: hypothetical protein GWN13_20555, partial [Phycisphaerae bacterium]|nr:hypothetical protein [Phycisphaerae bacterium]
LDHYHLFWFHQIYRIGCAHAKCEIDTVNRFAFYSYQLPKAGGSAISGPRGNDNGHSNGKAYAVASLAGNNCATVYSTPSADP